MRFAATTLVAATLLTLAPPAIAQRNAGASPSPFVTAEMRAANEARPVAALTGQTELATSIELGRVLGPAGGNGGVLGVLIILAMDRTTERLTAAANARADGQIAPLRAALSGFDANALALEATRAGFAGQPWFNAGPAELRVSDPQAEDAPPPQRLFALDHPQASQLGLVSWRYQMSPDFSQVQVIASVEIVDGARQTPRYRQQLISIVKLDRPSFVPEENVARWSANGGAPARRALEMAFARASQTIPRILELDQASYRHATDRRRTDRVIAVGYHGPVLFQDAAGPVFWARDGDQGLAAFVAVQTVAE
jgi:hypothetical protein